jgi:hypothetical protein
MPPTSLKICSASFFLMAAEAVKEGGNEYTIDLIIAYNYR